MKMIDLNNLSFRTIVRNLIRLNNLQFTSIRFLLVPRSK